MLHNVTSVCRYMHMHCVAKYTTLGDVAVSVVYTRISPHCDHASIDTCMYMYIRTIY